MSIIIPTHNEAQAIGQVLADLPSEVIVVDSNSSDGTPEIATKTGARFRSYPAKICRVPASERQRVMLLPHRGIEPRSASRICLMQILNETVVHSSSCDRVVVIMAKAPRPGAVRTRLIPGLSAEAVTALYRCLLEDTLELARRAGFGLRNHGRGRENCEAHR